MIDKGIVIPIASDHGGFAMKEFLIDKLKEEGFSVKDFGAFSEESVDYPDMIHPLAKAINDGIYPLGIMMCGSGNGAQMTANKYKGVRAGLCWTVEQAELIRLHNNANIISIPGRFIVFDVALEMVQVFLNTEFEGGRHNIRIEKISKTL
ncbi:MAG: ribose 5-phosphate isomerase B [Bacteroidales bacterium]|jgi:ribose 5-phosphate isomerase B|nr:ribose 5-phosphate isomerase B [Bacteroidales bacterium]